MNTTAVAIFEDPKLTLHRVKFILILTFQVPAVVLSLLIFFFFIKTRTVMEALHNRALFILLVVNFVQLIFSLPQNLHYLYFGYITLASPTYCTWWTFIEYSLYVISECLMATISVQRHMLVFYGHILRIRRMRIIYHHIPLIFCLTYPVIFYFFAIIVYPCDGTQWDYTNNLCGFANCYLLFNKVLGSFDWAVNNGLTMVINAIANLTLVVRVIRQKRRQQRPLSWKQQRRMTVQLFAVSSLYLVAWSPSLIVGLVQILGFPTFLAEIQTDYFLDLLYIVCLFLPWICIGLLPELSLWIRKLLHLERRRNAVGTAPISLTATMIQNTLHRIHT